MDDDDCAIEMMEAGGTHADNVRNFVEEVYNHIVSSLNLPENELLDERHMYFDMMRPEGTLCWWMDAMHPFSVLMQANDIDPVAEIDGARRGLGKVFVYEERHVMDTINTAWGWMRAQGKTKMK